MNRWPASRAARGARAVCPCGRNHWAWRRSRGRSDTARCGSTITRAVSGLAGSMIQFASLSRGFSISIGSSGVASGSRIPSGRDADFARPGSDNRRGTGYGSAWPFSDRPYRVDGGERRRHLVVQRFDLLSISAFSAIGRAAQLHLQPPHLLLDRRGLRLPFFLLFFARQHQIVGLASARSAPAAGSSRTGGRDRTCDRGSARSRPSRRETRRRRCWSSR